MDFSNENISIYNPKDKNVWVSTILKEIHIGYSKPLSVRALAERVNINKTTVGQGFKEITGYSINDYIVNYRLRSARRLLATTGLTVAEIGEKCGYKNTSFFNRQFKERIGLTPLRYRKTAVQNRKTEFAKKQTL